MGRMVKEIYVEYYEGGIRKHWAQSLDTRFSDGKSDGFLGSIMYVFIKLVAI